jgi:hypothetical protein
MTFDELQMTVTFENGKDRLSEMSGKTPEGPSFTQSDRRYTPEWCDYSSG